MISIAVTTILVDGIQKEQNRWRESRLYNENYSHSTSALSPFSPFVAMGSLQLTSRNEDAEIELRMAVRGMRRRIATLGRLI